MKLNKIIESINSHTTGLLDLDKSVFDQIDPIVDLFESPSDLIYIKEIEEMMTTINNSSNNPRCRCLKRKIDFLIYLLFISFNKNLSDNE